MIAINKENPNLECRSIRYPNRQISENSQSLILPDLRKRQIMRNLMNSQKQIMVGGSTDEIRGRNKHPAVPFDILEPNGADVELEGDDGEDDVFGEGFVAHEHGYRGVFLHDFEPARAVRLLRVEPEEVSGVFWGLQGRRGIVAGKGPAGLAALCERVCPAVETKVNGHGKEYFIMSAMA